MNTRWAVQLPRGGARAAARLRLRRDVRVCEASDALWLWGEGLTEELDLELRKLPGARRFLVDADENVTEVGRRLRAGELPPGPWTPLAEWVEPRPQPAALAGTLVERVALRLARGGSERPATVLEANVDAFAQWAAAAPAVRLKLLRMAASAEGRVVLWGAPMPPIAGRRFFDRDGVALPCGFEWMPAVEPAVVRALLKLDAGDLALFAEDGSYQSVAASSFARATRGAARATLAALARGGSRE